MRLFRLEKCQDKGKTVITLEGELAGEHVPVVEGYMKNLLTGQAPLVVCLRDVNYIDQAGINLLKCFVDHGVALQGSGVYTSFILSRLKKLSPACKL
jgi:anti-anti-sigma factor